MGGRKWKFGVAEFNIGGATATSKEYMCRPCPAVRGLGNQACKNKKPFVQKSQTSTKTTASHKFGKLLDFLSLCYLRAGRVCFGQEGAV